MNYKQLFLAASVACAAFAGCSEVEIERSSDGFFYPYGFVADTLRYYHGEVELRFPNVSSYSYEKGGTSKELYKKYVYYFNDLGYRADYQNCLFGCDDDNYDPWKYCCVCDIKSIHVVTNQDFDKDHPAGSNIDDLLSINLLSAYPYIKSGYKDYHHYDSFELQNIDPDFLKLNAAEFGNLRFNKKPETRGYFTFTVSIEMGADPVSGDTPQLQPQEFTIYF